MKRLLPQVFYNPLSLAGAVIALVNVGLILLLTVLMIFIDHPGPYADIIVYFLLPLIAFGGLVLMTVGVVRERRRRRRGLPERRLPVLDFNDPKQRGTVLMLGAGFVGLTLLYAFAGYKTYEFSESTQFCGLACHGVMKPEYNAHQFSYHAEVTCAECHVGPGAKYFVEAKLNGTRQLIATLAGKYPRPVPVPVHNLRPSQDTCETCHGPRYQFAERLESRTYFLPDETNTAWTVDMIFKMGGAELAPDQPARMHWHNTTTREIAYATADPKRGTIPWVQAKRRDGTVRTYVSQGGKFSADELAALPRRTMDCVDCHNRIGHYFRPPGQSVNMLMNLKVIDPALPEIKKVAVEILGAEYSSQDDAHAGIRSRIEKFYGENHPATLAAMRPRIEQAIAGLLGIYDRNYDPFMKVSWRDFPDNAGHMYSPGCFRCHDGEHVTEDGHVLSKDCTLCHTLIEHELAVDRQSATFKLMTYPHPENIGDDYKTGSCADCHSL
jgi:hypothetical protein